MAADGLVVDSSDMICGFEAVKVRRLKDGSLLGMAGSAADAETLAKWLLDGGDKPKLENVAALRLQPDGRLFYIEDAKEAVPAELPAALGTGRKLAMGALLAGKSPAEAVSIAAMRDINSGGTVLSLDLHAESAAEIAERHKAAASV